MPPARLGARRIGHYTLGGMWVWIDVYMWYDCHYGRGRLQSSALPPPQCRTTHHAPTIPPLYGCTLWHCTHTHTCTRTPWLTVPMYPWVRAHMSMLLDNSMHLHTLSIGLPLCYDDCIGLPHAPPRPLGVKRIAVRNAPRTAKS